MVPARSCWWSQRRTHVSQRCLSHPSSCAQGWVNFQDSLRCGSSLEQRSRNWLSQGSTVCGSVTQVLAGNATTGQTAHRKTPWCRSVQATAAAVAHGARHEARPHVPNVSISFLVCCVAKYVLFLRVGGPPHAYVLGVALKRT